MFSVGSYIVADASELISTEKTGNETSIQYSSDGVSTIHWKNNSKKMSAQDINMFEEHNVDIAEALESTDVYIQTEYIPFDEIVSSTMLSNDQIATFGVGDVAEEQFIHNKGYIKFTTKAYALGFYDGGIVYHIEETVQQLKSFFVHQNDNLIIRHGNNSVTLNIKGYEAKGSLFTPCTIYWPYGGTTNADELSDLNPDFSSSAGGVFYTFKVGGIGASGSTGTVSYGNSTVTGDYYLVATDTTEVQPVYIHNINWFISSLSVSFGPIGASINTDGGPDIMYGSPMTLKGYDTRIQSSILTLNPVDFGFEPQYFFYEKVASHSIQNWNFETKRLRTGYIENQYVILSPNRQNAGQAYLEFSFSVPIYELDTYLSFWSSSEKYTSSDSAYIQYKDKNGDWINLLDMLKCGMSTDRFNQSHYELNIVEGTNAIRFISNVQYPTSDRNKGRICIGDTKFINWKIN